jgi:hypothetical protein
MSHSMCARQSCFLTKKIILKNHSVFSFLSESYSFWYYKKSNMIYGQLKLRKHVQCSYNVIIF